MALNDFRCFKNSLREIYLGSPSSPNWKEKIVLEAAVLREGKAKPFNRFAWVTEAVINIKAILAVEI